MDASLAMKSLSKKGFPCGHGKWDNYGSNENASHYAFCEHIEYLRWFETPTNHSGWVEVSFTS